MNGRIKENYELSIVDKNISFSVEKTIIQNPGFETIGYEIGGKDIKCLNITVTNIYPGDHQGMLQSFMKSNIASFNSIKYAKECRLGGIDLDKSQGTKDLILAGFAHVKSISNYIDTFSLTDASSVQCKDQWISLPILSILKYSKTWYELYFDATLEDLSLKYFYDLGIKRLNEITIQEVITLFSSFEESINNIDTNFTDQDKFINYIRSLDKNKLCKIAGLPVIHKLFIELFQNRDVLTQTKWIIHIDKLKLPNIKTTLSGGALSNNSYNKRYKQERFSLYGGHLFR